MIARHGNYRFTWLLALAAALVTWPGSGRRTSEARHVAEADSGRRRVLFQHVAQPRAVRGHQRTATPLRRSRPCPWCKWDWRCTRRKLNDPDSGAAKFNAVLQNPEMSDMLDLAADMASNEIFVYGDKSFVNFAKLYQAVNAAASYGPMIARITGQAKDRDPQQLQAEMVISALAKNVDLIGVPSLIVGFKLKNAELAKEQLIKLRTDRQHRAGKQRA